MKKKKEKKGILKIVGASLSIAAAVLLVVAMFVNAQTADTVLKVLALVSFVVGGMILAVNSEEHRLAKSILVFVIAAVLSTWALPYGYFQGSDFYEYGMTRIGIVDIGFALYYSVNFLIDKIVYLLVLGGFYGILSKTSGYQRLVSSLANKFKHHPAVTSVIMSVILIVFTSLFTQTFAVLVFVPFLISILLKMNLDKLTAFAVTFGSILVGILGCTYGTDSLTSFNAYLSQEVTLGLTYRFIVAACALVLYNVLLVLRVRKVVKDTKKNAKNSELMDDPFEVEETKEKVSSIPVIVILALVALVVILGYVDWNAIFKITIFTEFHEWITGLTIGDDFTVFSYLFGGNIDALGSFKYVFTLDGILLLASVVIAFLYKFKVNEYFESFYEGVKRIIKPLLFLIGAYVIFGIFYMSPVVPFVINWLANLVKGFNPFLTSVLAFISAALQADFGYIGYTVGGLVTTTYASNLTIAHTIFTSMFGFVQMFLPTSAILVVGLSMAKVDYKDWLKYIWMFLVAILVVILVLATVVTYIA